MPIYFIYTHLLLLITELGVEDSAEDKILDIMTECLGYHKGSCNDCIKKLVIYGMIDIKYNDDHKHSYKITPKGQFVLDNFFNNIDYLYHSCLDTKLPHQVFDYMKQYIIPNNVSPETRDRYFLTNSIIIGVSFLNFLKFKNQQFLNNENIRHKLFSKNINIETFELPVCEDQIKECSIRCSIFKKIKKIVLQQKYVDILDDWFRKFNL